MEKEKRLIVDALKKYHDAKFTPGVYEHSIFGKAAMLLEADAVEVVRCKNCMQARAKDHREPTETQRELICQCAKHHYIPALWGARMSVNPDDFCSYGERRMSMKTRNEVIQALKCCLINEGDPCEGCPCYREDGYCIDNVMADALELLED